MLAVRSPRPGGRGTRRWMRVLSATAPGGGPGASLGQTSQGPFWQRERREEEGCTAPAESGPSAKWFRRIPVSLRPGH